MNQLLVNPKLPDEEKKIFKTLQAAFENKFGTEGYYFVPSSGSSKREGESSKLIALTDEAVANSAERFNHYFNASADDNWGLVLPTFHVAGLSVLQRARLAQARVFSTDWQPKQMAEWFLQNRIAFLSVVPTQVHDLVELQVPANAFIKKVFVGGSTLSSDLREKFRKLGWPLVETYGMTETCSMIAVKEDDLALFKVLPGVEVCLEDGVLCIHCNSVAHSSIQMKQGQIEITEFEAGRIRTEDQARIEKQGDDLYLQLIGRASDYVKIFGEGVSVSELRDKLDKVAFEVAPAHRCLLAVPYGRSENVMVLVIDNDVDPYLADRLVEKFNQVVRGYERIHKVIRVDRIPFSDLGKVRVNELKEVVLKLMQAET